MSLITYTTKVENGGTTTAGRISAVDANEIKTVVNANTPYTQFVALINQSGTGAPTLTILKNDTGLTFTPSRTIAGYYALLFSSAPNPAKLEIHVGNQSNVDDTLITYFISSSNLFINTKDMTAGALADGLMLNTTLRINIYP